MKTRLADLGDLEVFYHVVNAGSLSAAARELGLSPAVVSRRLQKLEKKLGVRLLQRTTRHIAKTELGTGYYEHVSVILKAVEEAELFVRNHSAQVTGTLKITVPTTFGRLHVAPWIKKFIDTYPELHLQIDLTDKMVDIIDEGFDLAVRISSMVDSPLAARRLSSNNRVICASPDYLKRYGTPKTLDELMLHRILSASNHSTWLLEGPEGHVNLKVKSFITTNSSDLVREETLANLGIALRSTWDIGSELKDGALQRILPQYRGSSDIGIFAVYPSSHLVPTKVRAFVSYLAKIYGPSPYWDVGLNL